MDIRNKHYSRHVTLHSSAIFESLVSLYTSLLTTQWKHFKALAKVFPPPPGVTSPTYAARVYISHWFLDLYASNRTATREISPFAFAQYYHTDAAHFSTEYDRYLTLLNAAIRPTHIKGALEDAIYTPLISNSTNWDSDNPFDITGFISNYDYFMGILLTLERLEGWKMSPLVKDYLGRPSWLFDWHDEDCCAWFPAEGNYSKMDVEIAFVIGKACSPNLGPRDVDDSAFFVEGMCYTDFKANNLQRVVERRFYGSYEIRTIGLSGSDYPKMSCSKPTLDQIKVAIESGHSYRITDWTYYARVILGLEPRSRTGVLKSIVIGTGKDAAHPLQEIYD